MGGALAKIIRVLPERVAGPVRAVRAVTVPPPDDEIRVSPELTTALIGSCAAGRRLRLVYRTAGEADRPMEVDPWAVVLRHSRWYLLGWSHTAGARRVLRVDRIAAAEPLPEEFTPPAGLDALRALEEHLSQGWRYPVEVLVDATVRRDVVLGSAQHGAAGAGRRRPDADPGHDRQPRLVRRAARCHRGLLPGARRRRTPACRHGARPAAGGPLASLGSKARVVR